MPASKKKKKKSPKHTDKQLFVVKKFYVMFNNMQFEGYLFKSE